MDDNSPLFGGATAYSQLRPAAIIVEQGKLLDFIDGLTQRRETPEEYVRQEIAKSLVREYRYARTDVAVEFGIRVGSRKPRVDLAIFSPGTEHRQENIRLLVECKSSTVKSADKKEGVEQLRSYMAACPNVTHGMWTNGLERYCFNRFVADGRVQMEEVPDVPQYGAQDDEDRPRFDQLKPATSDALLFAFRRSHNYIAGNQGLQKNLAFWELLKLIFCKIRDERSDEISFYAGRRERHGINGPLKVKARIDALFQQVKEDYPQIFGENEVIDLEGAVLAYIVAQLQMYSLLDSDVDVKGRAYEEVVGSNLRGDRGEFFTPRNICRLAVAMLDPTEKDTILDPACGTGGFLITAMNHVIERIRSAELAKWGDNVTSAEKATTDRVVRFARSKIVGLDFNPHLVKASKMNMVMNNDGAGGLYQANALESPAKWNDALRERKLLGTVDLLFTNPPFGSKLRIEDPAVLGLYDLGHQWHYDPQADLWKQSDALQKSQPPEILFIERCLKFLKPGYGRAALVLPDGILGSPGLGYVRQWIFENARVLASIDLHPDTFQPFVSVQTSLLLLQRKSPEEMALERAAGRLQDYALFMAMADRVGHNKRGQATYVRDRDGNEIVAEEDVRVKEWVDGVAVYRRQTVRRKVLDDNTLQIAEAFRQWLSSID